MSFNVLDTPENRQCKKDLKDAVEKHKNGVEMIKMGEELKREAEETITRVLQRFGDSKIAIKRYGSFTLVPQGYFYRVDQKALKLYLLQSGVDPDLIDRVYKGATKSVKRKSYLKFTAEVKEDVKISPGGYKDIPKDYAGMLKS